MAYPSDLNFVLDVLKIRFLHRKFCLELLLRFRPTIFFVKELVFEKTPKFNKNILKNYTVLHLRKVNFELAPSEPFLLILCSSIVIHQIYEIFANYDTFYNQVFVYYFFNRLQLAQSLCQQIFKIGKNIIKHNQKSLNTNQDLMSKQSVKVFQIFNPKIQRGKAKTCELCTRQFSIFVREHQCKRCLRAVCDACGTKKKDVYKQNMTKQPHRICDVCAKQNQFLEEHVKENNLIFGVASEQGRKWSKRIQRKLSDSLNNLQIEDSKNSGRFTKQVFKEMWDSYNYSLREFLGLLTFTLKQDDVYEKIRDVYQKILKHYPEQKMENVCYVIIFVLCYCDQQLAIQIVLFLLQLKSSIVQSKQLINLFLGKLGMNQDEIKKVGDFIKIKTRKFVSNFSINQITAQASIHLVSRLIQRKKIDQLYIHFALVIQLNKETLVKANSSKSENDLSLIRNCNLQRISNKYRVLGPVKTQNYIRKQVPNQRKQVLNQKLQGAKSQANISEQNQQNGLMPVKSLIKHKHSDSFINSKQYIEEELNLNENTKIFKKKTTPEFEDTQSEFRSRRKDDDRSISSFSMKLRSSQNFQQIAALIQPKNQYSQQQHYAVTNNQYEAENQSEKLSKSSTSQFKKVEEQSSPIRLFSTITPQKSQKLEQKSNQECRQCQKYLKKIKQLQHNINNKNLQIQNLQKKIRLKTQNKSNSPPNLKGIQFDQANNQIQKKLLKVQQELRQSNSNNINLKQKFDANQKQKLKIEKEIVRLQSELRRFENQKQLASKIRQQNVSLKNQVQQISLTNKMLKNKLQSASFESVSTSGKGNQLDNRALSVSEAQLKKMNEMLRSSLMQKNNQLEALMKQNKLLAYQVESLSISNNSEAVQKLEKEKLVLDRKNRQLMQKIQQLSEMLIKQQAEKLQLSDLVFQYKQSQKQMTKKEQSKSMTAVGSEKSSDCSIF